MSNLDITNNYELILTDINNLQVSPTTVFTADVDVANADAGFTFAFFVISPLNGMTINIKLQDNDGSGWVDIPDNKIISVTGVNSIVIDTDPPVPGNLNSLGAFSNSKLVRAEINTSGHTTNVGLVTITYTKTEQLPPSGN